ncbi:MAG: hypothetical protein ACOC85_05540, partial [Thermoplasmatota archaeon]
MRSKGSTAIHRSGFKEDIDELLEEKEMREGFVKYRDMIEDKFGLDLTSRQVRYYYNRYVKPEIVVSPKDAEEEIEERRELINVLEEKTDLYLEQKERLERLEELEEERGEYEDAVLKEKSMAHTLINSIEKTKQDL